MSKLHWDVEKNSDGTFKRRTIDGDNLHMQYIDVTWTHDEGFPEDTIEVPTTHPPNIQYQTKQLPARDEIKDQLIVTPAISDSTIAAMLDEKRHTLAKSLKINP
jgi:hypothetical protein